ncbi:hypothetical protein CJ030_MR8G022756 [Morella rubra]|uniref:Protein kinase domain-containing protein n=1 Tax=Morella rubra TaxID=262757 RepID=A0A6A1UQB6_9ROSI|nr:hypothetical protein CJ030_MR8G022756 [Morella rubra]
MALIKQRVLVKGTHSTVFLAESTDPDALPIAVKSSLFHRFSLLRLEDRVLTQLRGLPVIVQSFGSTISIKNSAQYDDLLLECATGGTLANNSKNLSKDGKDFLSKCFARDSTESWTPQMLLDHPFILDQVSAPQLSSGGPLDLRAPSFLHRSLGYSDGLPPPCWASFSSHNSLGSLASLTQPKCCSFSLLDAPSDLATKVVGFS